MELHGYCIFTHLVHVVFELVFFGYTYQDYLMNKTKQNKQKIDSFSAKVIHYGSTQLIAGIFIVTRSQFSNFLEIWHNIYLNCKE